ncbi:MAG: hypothetical protein WB783_05425 [Arenicellales bacterium]
MRFAKQPGGSSDTEPFSLRLLPARHEIWLITALLVLGTGAILALEPLLTRSNQALGPHTVALFVPFFAGLVYLAYHTFATARADGVSAIPIIICLLLSVLFLHALFQPIAHYHGDDPWRYSVYAHNMLREHTLWGSGGVYYKHHGKDFIDQPGYRYYLAAMIWLTGGENRLTQLLNLTALLAVLTVGAAVSRRLESPLGRFTALILILSAPYAAKNVVQGLSEWLAVSLGVLYAGALLRDRQFLAIVLLALIPFVRQNLIPVAVALAALQVFATRRYVLVLPFLLVFLLPVYHNLYYAGDFRLLVENKGAILNLSVPTHELAARTLHLFAWKLGTYVGIPNEHIDLHTIAAALLFAPASFLGLIYFSLWRPPASRLLCIVILALLVGPTVFFGHAYYPRFVYTNYVMGFMGLLALGHLRPASERSTGEAGNEVEAAAVRNRPT